MNLIARINLKLNYSKLKVKNEIFYKTIKFQLIIFSQIKSTKKIMMSKPCWENFLPSPKTFHDTLYWCHQFALLWFPQVQFFSWVGVRVLSNQCDQIWQNLNKFFAHFLSNVFVFGKFSTKGSFTLAFSP